MLAAYVMYDDLMRTYAEAHKGDWPNLATVRPLTHWLSLSVKVDRVYAANDSNELRLANALNLGLTSSWYEDLWWPLRFDSRDAYWAEEGKLAQSRTWQSFDESIEWLFQEAGVDPLGAILERQGFMAVFTACMSTFLEDHREFFYENKGALRDVERAAAKARFYWEVQAKSGLRWK